MTTATPTRCVVCFEDKSLAEFKATCASHAAEVCAACLAHPLMGRRCAVCRAELVGVFAATAKRSRADEERDAARAVRRRVRHDAREAQRLFCEINQEYFAALRARLRLRAGNGDGDAGDAGAGDEGNDDDDDDTSSVSVDEDSDRDEPPPSPPQQANANATEAEFVPIRVRVDGRYLVFYHEV